MTEKTTKYGAGSVGDVILTLRGQKVILDADLANVYGVLTKRLNEQVKRNLKRFPIDFMFELSHAEVERLNRSQIATGSQKHRDLRFPPFAFTEHGAIMAATVLNSPRAVEMSVFVVRAFVKMREYLSITQVMDKRLAEIEKMLLIHDSSLRILFQKIRPLLLPKRVKPKRKIGFRSEEKRAKYRV